MSTCFKFLILGAKLLHDVHQWEVSYLEVDTWLGGFYRKWDSSYVFVMRICDLEWSLWAYVVCAHFGHVEVLCSWKGCFVKNSSFWSWLSKAMSQAYMSLSILLVMLVLNFWLSSCLCLNFSILSCSLYIWEAQACICRLDSCITNKGARSYPILALGRMYVTTRPGKYRTIA
jgi:hypothetical protein